MLAYAFACLFLKKLNWTYSRPKFKQVYTFVQYTVRTKNNIT